MHSTPAAGALLTGLTTLAAVTGCVSVSPDPGTGTRHGPGAGQAAPAASGPAASPLPGREELSTIGPVPRRRHVTPAPASSAGAAEPEVTAPDGTPAAPPTRAPKPERVRPARTAQPAAPPPAEGAGGAVDVCGIAGDYGRWAPGSREAAACADYFER